MIRPRFFKLAALFMLLVLGGTSLIVGRIVYLSSVYPIPQCGVRLADRSIPLAFLAKVLAQEDHLFFRHSGIEWHNLRESVTANWRSGRIERGASTIPMQVIKNCWHRGSRDKRGAAVRWIHKVEELLGAYLIVSSYPKEEILRAYLTSANFFPDDSGQAPADFRTPQDAAQFYFNKPLVDLDDDQQWSLIVTLRNREFLNPRALGSLNNLSKDAQVVLVNARERSKWVQSRFHAELKAMPFTAE